MAEAAAAPAPQSSPSNANVKGIKLLKELGMENVSETDAKRLFDLYADVACVGASEGELALSVPALYRLLIDLQEVLGRNPVVTEPAVAAVLGEVKLQEGDAKQVTWVELKSFFVYLNQTPLQTLGALVGDILPDAALATACVVKFAQPPRPDGLVERLQTEFSKLKLAPEGIFASFPTEGDSAASGAAAGAGAEHSAAAVAEVLVTFSNAAAAESLVAKCASIVVDGASGGLKAARYAAGTRFPSFVPVRGGDPSKVATVLASGVILGKQAASKAKQFDDKHKITETVTSKAQEIDSKFKVTETAKATAETAKKAAHDFDEKHQLSARASAKAQEIDEKYAVRQKVSDTTTKVMQNPTVKKGFGFLSSLAAKATTAAQDLAGETMEVVASREAAPAASGASTSASAAAAGPSAPPQ